MKLLYLLFIALVVSIFGCLDPSSESNRAEVVNEIAREQLGVSILAVNLLDIYNYPHSPYGTTWQTRYNRILTWMKNTHTFPDIIALQEANGFTVCPTDARRMPDYASIDFLLDGIRAVTGEQYRIAYFISGKEGGTWGDGWVGDKPAQFCTTRGDRALLYRPSRVKNVIVRPPPSSTGIKLIAYDDPNPPTGTHLASSMPCCFPASDRRDVCSVIDGSTQASNRCTTPTPIGVAWTRRELSSENPGRPQDAVFSRFELVNQPGSYIHIYNVHRAFLPNNDNLPASTGNINQLVTDMESRFNSLRNPTLYPPILVGDFNIGLDRITEIDYYFSRFEVGMWGPELMGALFGKNAYFPSHQKAYANLQQRMPELLSGEDCKEIPAKSWSDHCAIFFRVEPSKRLTPPAPLPPPPLPSPQKQCLTGCAKQHDKCMAKVPNPDSQSPQQCVKEFRSCQANCQKTR